jgi:chemotaxis protein methyltransferase CheR
LSLIHDPEAIEARLLLQAIYECYGYDFRGYAPDLMERRVKTALAKSGMKHLGELLHRVLLEPDYFHALLQDLTVQVSEMFRDPLFYLAFREKVIPVLRTYPHVKIWHAGCATGEEAYTTAILLLEEGLLKRTQIYATDIDTGALEQARGGAYSEAQLSSFETNYREAGGRANPEDYYTSAYDGMAFKEVLRKSIVFFQHNLVTDYALGEMQVIFCRNVLIYFGEELRSRVTRVLAQGLCQGGFLCLGKSEHIPMRWKEFEELAASERIYRKVAS